MKIEKKVTYSISTVVMSLLFTGCTTPSTLLKPHTKFHETQRIQNIDIPQYNTEEVHKFEKPTPTKEAYYANTMKKIATGIPDDPEYKRIELNTPEKKKWFRTLTYRLWDRQITRYEFLTEALKKYPTHKHEFDFIINGFTSVYNN